MQRIQAYLKNGQVVEFEAEKFEITRNGFGALVRIEWTPGDAKTRLHYLDPGELVAVTYQEL